jgi:signal-transduction protein with cAMP-binding, CBS, and nucleotidyltransferase domain
LPIASRITNIATKPIVAIDEGRSIIEGAVLMLEHDISSIVVTSHGGPVGIVTERDMLRRVTMQGLNPTEVKIGAVMSSPLTTIDGEASLADATALMLERKIRHLLVTENEKITGICTNNDIERQVYDIFSALAQL